ncbi:MAG: ATP-binding cassette domain-containing protein [Kineosporiaceae bacterium]
MTAVSVGVRVTGLGKRYGETVVFEGLNFAAEDGRVTALRGPNGSGKSTLLGCLAGSIPVDGGTVEVDGRAADLSSSAHWRWVYGVLDDFSWLPDLTVTDHLVLLSAEADPGAARSALAAFGVTEIGDRLPASLSSGQRQRGALATLLVRRWRVLLLDEPEMHLDGDGVQRLARVLSGVATPGRCVVVSTHSEDLLRRLDATVVGFPPTRAG